jgi:hypothetical protein
MAFSLEQAKTWKRTSDSLAMQMHYRRDAQAAIERFTTELEKITDSILTEPGDSLLYVVDNMLITIENKQVVSKLVSAIDTTKPMVSKLVSATDTTKPKGVPVD